MKQFFIMVAAAFILTGIAIVANSVNNMAIRSQVYEDETEAGGDPLSNIDGIKELMMEDPYDGEPVRGGTLVLRLAGEPNTLNPIFMSSTSEFTVIGLIYDSGLDYDFNQQIVPNIYKSWEHQGEYKDFTITINEGLLWSDGEPLTADDFKFTYETIKRDDVNSRIYEEDVAGIELLEVIDDYTFRVVFKDAEALWYSNISLPVIPKHIYENVDDIMTTEYNRSPVVSGPYKVKEWVTQQEIRLVRNENYRGKADPYIDEIILKIIPDTATAFNAFMAGQIDFTEINSEQLVLQTNEPRFRDKGKVKFRSTPGISYIGWNMFDEDSFFYDKRVRYAMAHAIDRKKIQKYIYYGLNELSNGNFHPDQWFSNPDVEMIPYDLKEAGRLLAEAGWRDTNNDGILDKDGRPFSFRMKIPQSPRISNICQAYQQDLELLGIDMQIHQLEWATFIDQVRNNKFEAYMAGWGGGFFPQTSRNIWHSTMYPEGRNYVGFKNDRVDELLDMGEIEFDIERQKAIYAEIQEIIYEEQPYCFLFFSNTIIAHHERVRGIRMSLYGPFRYSPGLYSWFIPEDQQFRE